MKIVATEDLPKYSLLPYLGKIIYISKYKSEIINHFKETECIRYQYLRERRIGNGQVVWIDATRFDEPFENIGMKGLAAAGVVNEPNVHQTINLASIGAWYITLRKIKKGEELVAIYGSNYSRPAGNGYKVNSKVPVLPIALKTPPNLSKILNENRIIEPCIEGKTNVWKWAKDEIIFDTDYSKENQYVEKLNMNTFLMKTKKINLPSQTTSFSKRRISLLQEVEINYVKIV